MLHDYLNDSADTLNLANTTEPLEPPSASFDGGWPKMSSPRVTDASASMVHRLDLAATLNLKIATGRPAPSVLCCAFFLFPFPMVMVVTNRKFPLRVLHSGDTFDKTCFRLIQEGRLAKSIKAMKGGEDRSREQNQSRLLLVVCPSWATSCPRKL